MKRSKIIILSVILVLLVLWCFRYYQLNDGKLVKHKYKEEQYKVNEKVEYGDDVVYGKDDKSPGYAITFINRRVVDCKKYLQEINKNEEDFEIKLPEKVMEVTVNISNESNDDLSQGVDFYPIWLIGRDWYETYSAEFTAYANEIYKDNPDQAFGIQVKKGKSYKIKIIYPLAKADFSTNTWKNINEELMWLTITCRPKRKLICIE